MARYTVHTEPANHTGSHRHLTKAEIALRESEERFRALADNIAQLAWMADKNGRVFWHNQRWSDYTGIDPDKMKDEDWNQIIHPDHFQRVRDKYLHSIETGQSWEDTFLMRGRDGQYRWFVSRALPTKDEKGEIVRWLGTNTDITEQREAEEMLREADQRKDEYLAMLGHELRNPLAGIIAATQLAKLTSPPDPRLQQAIQVLERQSNHVARIVDGLLEYSRIARGKIHLEHRPVDITKLLREVIQDRHAQLAKRNLQLHQQIPEGPIIVNGDWLRLVQIFDNLLGNAIKFTQAEGRISVDVQTDSSRVLVCIGDTGVGIHEEMLTRIFEPFSQEMEDAARAAGGLGLGLSLARNLAELHGGSIEARSQGAGRGAEFLVSLPLAHHAAAPQPAGTIQKPEQSRVLIVEDNEDAADTLATLLELKGHGVHIARTAPEALEFLERDDVDIILCDIGLPGMSGYEFAQRVRANPRFAALPLIATTGYGQPEDRRRSMQAGFDEHITKPVSIEELDKYLSRAGATRH